MSENNDHEAEGAMRWAMGTRNFHKEQASEVERLRAEVEQRLSERTTLDRQLSELAARNERLTRERDRLRDIIERDRTKAAEIIANARAVVSRRSWLAEGRGSFAYDDERYQEEFGAAVTEMLEALQPLGVLAADWSDCPKDFQAARIDWKSRATAAERERDEARAIVHTLSNESGLLQLKAWNANTDRDAAIARAEAAEQERDYWQRARNEWAKSADILQEENKRAEKKLAIAEEALKFYADAEVYKPDATGRVGDLTYIARAAEAKVDALAKEVAEWRSRPDAFRAEAAEAKVAKLREALKPFAELWVTRFMTDGIKYEFRIDAGDLRRARAILQETEQ